METFFLLLIAALLLLLNAFFVLAEFAAVKARPTRMEELAANGNHRAHLMQHVQLHLDQYLSVCQVGITFASIGLGFIGEPAIARLVAPLLVRLGTDNEVAAHAVAIAIAYAAVSYLHIVIGELVPKTIAIRKTDAAALLIAYPLRVFYYVFFVPLWILNVSANGVLKLLRMPPTTKTEYHSEDELRLILNDSQSGGIMSFRRLLYIENVLDMGALSVRNAMRPRTAVRCLVATASREENDKTIAEARYSRYPLIDTDPDKPSGIVHVKALYLAAQAGKDTSDLRAYTRPYITTKENAPLEQLLGDMQRKGCHVALVMDAVGKWCGFITMEDVVEEVIGAVEEEFPLEVPVYLSDMLNPKRIVLDAAGKNILEATRLALQRVPAGEIPVPLDSIMLAVADREKTMCSYVGHRLAVPHARLASLSKPIVVMVRLRTPMPAPVSGETIALLFILLTPSSMPRIHQVLLARIAGIIDNEIIEERLYSAATPAELQDTIRIAEQILLG